jgi:hypothetical protein
MFSECAFPIDDVFIFIHFYCMVVVRYRLTVSKQAENNFLDSFTHEHLLFSILYEYTKNLQACQVPILIPIDLEIYKWFALPVADE